MKDVWEAKYWVIIDAICEAIIGDKDDEIVGELINAIFLIRTTKGVQI